MKISIVLSTYNGESYILEQLESIRKQKRKADEVLIFDDCSTDKTVSIIDNYIKQYKLFDWKVEVNKMNMGWKKNFMVGIWNATGDLIFPCDQDDIWDPDKLGLMEKIMIDNSQIQVLTSNYEAFYETGETRTGPEVNDGKLVKQMVVDNIFNTKFPGCTYCIRKSFVRICKKYWEPDFPHDAFFWRMGMFSDTLFSYHKSLIYWRKHKNSTYTIESVKSKTKYQKRVRLDYALRVTISLKKFIFEYRSEDFKQKEHILDNTSSWIQQRIEFYDSRKIIHWLRIFKYHKCYDRIRQYFGDFYLAILKTEKVK